MITRRLSEALAACYRCGGQVDALGGLRRGGLREILSLQLRHRPLLGAAPSAPRVLFC